MSGKCADAQNLKKRNTTALTNVRVVLAFACFVENAYLALPSPIWTASPNPSSWYSGGTPRLRTRQGAAACDAPTPRRCSRGRTSHSYWCRGCAHARRRPPSARGFPREDCQSECRRRGLVTVVTNKVQKMEPIVFCLTSSKKKPLKKGTMLLEICGHVRSFDGGTHSGTNSGTHSGKHSSTHGGTHGG